MLTQSPCPSVEDLLDPIPEEVDGIGRHLRTCPRCRALRSLAREGVPPRAPDHRRAERVDIPPLRLAGRAPVTMPDRVRTGDIWQVLSDERDERYVVVIAGLAGYDARPYFTVAGTSPHVEYVGPGDVVVDKASRGIRVGYEFMLCTWSAAGVPERQFEQFL